ncbi:MAG: hypothetical protein FJW14_10705 [Acidimicrobiia bacterium]|nr:hypothetical protein [Acidimicrobiia bacterium]
MQEHFSQLSALVHEVRRRWRTATALRAWSLAATGAGVAIALALLTDRLLQPEGPALIALWAVAAGVALVSIASVIRPLRQSPRNLQVARLIEECCPELEDSLVTAVAEFEATGHRAMTAAVVSDAAARIRGIDIDRIVSRRAVRTIGIRAAAATAVLAVLAGVALAPMSRAAAVAALYLFPERLLFEVTPGDVTLRAGAPLRIVARIPGLAGVTPVLRTSDTESPMEADGDGFVAAFDRVDDSFSYVVAAGGAASREFSVTVVRPPRVERIDLRYQYPPAFGMQAREEEDGGDIYGPAGTRVRVTVYTDKPVTQASLNVTGGKPVPLSARVGTPDGVGATHASPVHGEITISDDGSYRVALADADGLSNPGDTEYFIRTLEDRPPDVRIVRPATDRKVTPIEEVPIEARADDDFGIASLELVYAVRGGEEKAVPFQREGTGIAVTGRRIVYLEDLDVKPGDFVTYYARARDVSRGKRSSEARSDIFFLEVTPFEEEFVASQSQGAGSGEEQGLEEMVQAQKDIITATWRLDRRSRDAGGRSEDDIRTVGRAQRELRARAMTMLTQMSRAADLRRRRQTGGGGRAGQAAAADPSTDAIRKASEAMARATQALEALQTGGALPHEMTALNELLRAQAEVRRREIQQQQAQGNGRGQNRQTQDLSSLFDRELARQQQTNYETPNSRETRQQQNGENDQTADRLRELARRQEALNKEQQSLAESDGRNQEEMRRELERLTREQTELRRQAEDLARQIQQQRQPGGRGQQQQPGGNGQQQQAGRDLERIAEDMQGAASELRRDNPGQASQRGSRAAEGLRDLEQRMRSDQPDNRRRALGELQLESRQLADGQRRLGNERSQPNDAEASRRRAGEQERLADRAERLEESVRQMAGGPQRGEERERNALGEAARQLERQNIPERMREAARADQPSARRQGEEIAKNLDQLAASLGAAAGQSDESQRLSDELSRLREMREQVAELDRELAQLRQQQEGGQRGQNGRQNQNGRGAREGGAHEGGRARQQGQRDAPWEGARDLLEQLRQENGVDIDSPEAEGFNPGRSAPGTEAWKQDFAAWDTLKVQIAAALERAERETAARLRGQQASDRLNAGTTQRVPDQYKQLIEKYYRALAK